MLRARKRARGADALTASVTSAGRPATGSQSEFPLHRNPRHLRRIVWVRGGSHGEHDNHPESILFPRRRGGGPRPLALWRISSRGHRHCLGWGAGRVGRSHSARTRETGAGLHQQFGFDGSGRALRSSSSGARAFSRAIFVAPRRHRHDCSCSRLCLQPQSPAMAE